MHQLSQEEAIRRSRWLLALGLASLLATDVGAIFNLFPLVFAATAGPLGLICMWAWLGKRELRRNIAKEWGPRRVWHGIPYVRDPRPVTSRFVLCALIAIAGIGITRFELPYMIAAIAAANLLLYWADTEQDRAFALRARD